MLNEVFPAAANNLVKNYDLKEIAHQYKWHLARLKARPLTSEDKPGGMLVAAIEHNKRPPRGHPDEQWFKRKFPYQYMGEQEKVFGGPKARGGGRKSRRTANKGRVAGAAIVPGGLKYGDKHGALGKEKRQHRGKVALDPDS